SAASSRSISVLTLCQLARARRTSAPTVRATPGRRSGPSTSNATTAISAISPKPTSNMARSGFGAFGLAFARLRLRLGRRRIGLELRLCVAVLHALAEALDRRADVLADVAEALGAENQRDNDQHDEPVPDAETTHDAYLEIVEKGLGTRD